MRTHLSNLLAGGPNQTTAFLPHLDAETLAETLAAFANADGGTVLVGITPEGDLTGDVLGEDVEALLSRALGLCRPPVATERLSPLPDGRLLYRLKRRWRDGTSHVIFEPMELIANCRLKKYSGHKTQWI